MKKKTLKTTSILLILCLLFSVISLTAFAQTDGVLPADTPAQEAEPYIVRELTDRRTEYEKHFLLSNGQYTVAAYGTPVHYKDENGNWQDIDNSLRTDGDTITNGDSNLQTEFTRYLSADGTVKLTANDHTITWGYAGVSGSEAEIPTAEQQATGDAQFLQQPDLTGELLYEDAFPGVDLQFTVSAAGVKDNLILNNNAAQNSFVIHYAFSGLAPQQVDSRTIALKDSAGNIVYTVTAPIMIDANGGTSDALTLSMLSANPSGMTVRLAADTAWLEDAAYPVVIDPSVGTSSGLLEIGRVNEKNGYTDSGILAGKFTTASGEEDNRIVVQIKALSRPTTGFFISGAEFTLYHSGFQGTLSAYDVTYDGDLADMTWSQLESGMSDQPTDSVSYTYGASDHATLQITRSVQNFFNNGTATIAITSDADSLFNADIYSSGKLPQVTYTYVEQTGQRDIYSFHTQEAGRAGTVYVNDLTGDLSIDRVDFSYPADSMAASAGMRYAKDANGIYRWKSIYDETITTADGGYQWERSDGQIVNMLKTKTVDGETYYYDENQKDYQYYPASKKLIDSENGTVYFFDGTGPYYLIKIAESEEEDAACITITRTASAISSVKDGDNQVYSYTYTNGNLTKIAYLGTGTTQLDSVSYTYNTNGTLSTVNYQGEISSYAYNGFTLTSVTAPGDHRYAYVLNTVGRVKTITEQANDNGTWINGNSLTIDYQLQRTTYTDLNGSQEICVFDDNGYLITVMNEKGYAVNSKKDENGALLGSTDVTLPVDNLLSNTSFEDNLNGWSASALAFCTHTAEHAFMGTGGVKINHPGGGTEVSYLRQIKGGLAAGHYTFSAYVLASSIGNGGNAQLKVQYTDENGAAQWAQSAAITASSDEWQRLSVTVELTGSANTLTLQMQVSGSAASVAYFDAAQLENHKVAYTYNPVSRNYTTSGGWSFSDGAAAVANTDLRGGLTGNVIELPAGKQGAQALYTVGIKAQKGDEITFSAWIKADGILKDGASTGNNSAAARINLYGLYKNTSGGLTIAGCDGNHSINHLAQGNWYKITDSFVTEENLDAVRISVEFRNQTGVLLADGFEVNNNGFATPTDSTTETSVTDDETGITTTTTTDKYTGEVLSVVKTNADGEIISESSGGQTSTTTYAADGSAVTTTVDDETGDTVSVSKTDANGREYYYSANGKTTEYTFDGDTDKTTSETITVGTLKLKTFTAYSEEQGSEVVTSTDASGNVTKSYTDKTTGNLLKQINGKNVATEYDYDPLQNLVSLLQGGKEITYTYEHDQIKTVTANEGTILETVYTFVYTPFGDLSAIKVGNSTLVSYTYTDNINRLPATTTFGNGQTITYTYNDDLLLTNQSCGQTLNVSYAYDELGNLLKTTDSINNTVTKQAGDETQVWNLAETSLLHSFAATDEQLKETIGGTVYTTGYSETDATGTQNASTTVSYEGYTQTTYTDGFGRISQIVTKSGDNVLLTQTFSYQSRTLEGQTLTTGKVASITTTTANGQSTTESYTYDTNGNILTISKNNTLAQKYSYDSLDRLSQTYDYETGKSDLYSYDPGGNFSSIIHFDLAADGTQTYTGSTSPQYADSTDWPDRMTGYGGDTITYDNAGNPTSYRGATLSWQNGRELSSYVKDGATAQYVYDANGLRTKKTTAATQYTYTWANGQLTHQAWGENNLHFYYDAQGAVIGFAYNGAMYTYVKNLQGDVTGILDSAGTVVANYSYDVWGKVLSATGSMAQINPLRYRGYYYDTDTGLYYLQSRYYDPQIGRFINADDPGLIQSLSQSTVMGTNLFVYCDSNPVMYSDPSGYYNIKSFNCYAYAFGIHNKWLIPGKGNVSALDRKNRFKKSFDLPHKYSVDQIANWIIKDFGKNKVRKLSSKNGKLKKGEYRIAVRVSVYSDVLPLKMAGPLADKTIDFHLWKQNPKTGEWWDKPGQGAIRKKGKVDPNKTSNWYMYTQKFPQKVYNRRGNIFTRRNLYYNSKTIYLAYKGNFWTK